MFCLINDWRGSESIFYNADLGGKVMEEVLSEWSCWRRGEDR